MLDKTADRHVVVERLVRPRSFPRAAELWSLTGYSQRRMCHWNMGRWIRPIRSEHRVFAAVASTKSQV